MTLRPESRMGLLACVAAAALIGLSVSAVWAEDVADKLLLRAQKSRQAQGYAAVELVAALELTERQARMLVPLIAQACEGYVETYDRQAASQAEMVGVFGAFAREDSLNQGFSPAVERRTARVNHEAKTVRETRVARMLELEEASLAILTEDQRAFAQSFRPGKPVRARKARVRKAAFNPGRRGRGRRTEGNPLATAQRELAALNRQMHPRLGAIGRHLLHPAAAEPVCEIIGALPNQVMRDALEAFERGSTAYPASECDRIRAQVTDLRARINNWNLINGLHVGAGQIEQIVALYAAAQDRIEEARATPQRRKRDRIRPAAVRAELERAVERVMNPGQRQVLADYKACLIPPKNLKNPVRVGQANDHSHMERWLTRARKMPNRRLRAAADGVIEREAERLGELDVRERRGRFSLLVNTAREAAEMSDTEFEIEKADLALRIAPRDRAKELKEEIRTLARAKGLPGKVSQFMLKPLFIEQLRLRHRQLAEGIVSAPTDLSDGPQAGNCEKGCAIKPKDKKKARKNKDRNRKARKNKARDSKKS